MQKRRYVLLLFYLSTFCANSQKLRWIPFNWVGDTIASKYYDKLAITIPVGIDNLPHAFNMQFDLGAVTTVLYENPLRPYLAIYPALASKIDTTLTFHIQGKVNPKFRDVRLKLGNVSFGRRDLGYFQLYGDSLPRDSVFTSSEKHIGTIAPDLFRDKILIIDYPRQRLCVSKTLPKEYSNTYFQSYKNKAGRIKIPVRINEESHDLLFDTGSSLFALLTTSQNANQLSILPPVDSLDITSWGEHYKVYAKRITAKIEFGEKQLPATHLYFDRRSEISTFCKEENIWGITGNAFFLDHIVIIDFKTKRFGIN